MSLNLDRSLDDIIRESDSKRSRGGPARRSDSRASKPSFAPYNRTRETAPRPGPSGPADCRVYVGNLAWTVTWQDLKDHMRSAGNVVRADVLTMPDGRSKGCALVEFSSPDEARRAISTLHDTDLKGRLIFVREDREDSASAQAAPARAAPASSRAPVSEAGNKVYFGNLPYSHTWKELKDLARAAGDVVHADIVMGADGRSKGFGIVTFRTADEAQHAIASLDRMVVDGRELEVRWDRDAGSERARPAPRRSASPARTPPARAGPPSDDAVREGRSVYFGNLAYSTTWQSLKDVCRRFGDVTYADVALMPDGKSRGFGVVHFSNAADAKRAIESLNESFVDGRPVLVRMDHGRQ